METPKHSQTGETGTESRAYVPPKLTYVGLVTEVVQAGAGKLSVDYPDGPDTRKPPGK
jgi:hypothetical protein